MNDETREPVFDDDPYSFTMVAIRTALKKGLLATDGMSDGEASVLGELNATLFKLDPSSAVVFDERDMEGG